MNSTVTISQRHLHGFSPPTPIISTNDNTGAESTMNWVLHSNDYMVYKYINENSIILEVIPTKNVDANETVKFTLTFGLARMANLWFPTL